jgi:hypothetical protein
MNDNHPQLAIISPSLLIWKDYYNLYQSSFPEDERRSESSLILMFENPHFFPNIIELNGHYIGLFNFWNFDNFFYIEHFAMEPKMRSKGYGKEFLLKFMHNKMVVLECEYPTNRLKSRRFSFYQNIGFQSFPFSYIQPSYSADKNAIPMLLLTNSNYVNKDSFDEVSSLIAKLVYQK